MPLITGALAAGNLLEPWVSMWTVAFALFFGFKVLTWSRVRTASVSLRRSLAYFLAWVGMDAEEFLSGEPWPFKPTTAEWRRGWLHVVAGLGLLSLAVPRLVKISAVLASWVGLAGLILVLHFGLFHLLALGWQVLGVPARPIMQKPLASRSLGEFWGRRWNSGFRQLSHDFVFKPLLRRIGPTGATLAAFSASGLIHELVISVPASGGYGLPTTYFLLQGLGVVAERSGLGAWLGLRRAVRGRAFTWLVAGIPVYALFHPAFIEQVAIPMFRALGVWQ